MTKIKEIFKYDIAKGDITLDAVRSGVETHEDLCGILPRQKKDSNSFVSVGELPQEQDSLQDKLERMDDVGKSTEETGTNDDQLSASIIAPTEQNSTFNCEEVDTIHRLFKDIICENRTILRVEVEKRCFGRCDGRNLFEKSTAIALVNQIKYERRKHILNYGPKRQ